MRNPVVVHDLHATQLIVAGVYLPTQYLVQSLVAREDDWRVFDLYDPMTKSHEVRADTDGSTRDHRYRDNIVVSPGCLSGYHARILQIFHSNTVFLTNDVGDLIPWLPAIFDERGLQ